MRALDARKAAEERAEEADIRAHLSAFMPAVGGGRGRRAADREGGAGVDDGASAGRGGETGQAVPKGGGDGETAASKSERARADSDDLKGVERDRAALRALQQHLGALQRQLASLDGPSSPSSPAAAPPSGPGRLTQHGGAGRS